MVVLAPHRITWCYLIVTAMFPSSCSRMIQILIPPFFVIRSNIFAHKMKWFLESFCVGGEPYSSLEKQLELEMLMTEVEARAYIGLEEKNTISKNTVQEERIPLNTLKVSNYQTCLSSVFEQQREWITSLTQLSTSLRQVAFTDRNAVVS